jgi:hypothetical protein
VGASNASFLVCPAGTGTEARVLERRVPRFVADVLGLDQIRVEAKLHACPHCQRFGTLIGHGLVRGYAPRGSERVVRGRRLVCSNRNRRPGCGRTVAIALATALVGRVVDTLGLWALWSSLVGSRPRAVPLQARTFGRLSRQLRSCQLHLRSALLAVREPPACTATDPIAQLWSHLQLVFEDTPCPIAAFQLRFQVDALGGRTKTTRAVASA